MKKVIVVSKTHLDLGFTDYAENIRQKYITEFIPEACAAAEALNTDKKHFVWTVGSWILKEALNDTNEKRRTTLIKALEKGNIAPHAMPFTVHSEILDKDTFLYGLSIVDEIDKYTGRKTIAAKMTDVPGHTVGIVPLLAKQGVKLLHIGVNPASAMPDVPECFLWKNGNSEVIVIYSGAYGGAYDCKYTGDVLYFDHTYDNGGANRTDEIGKKFSEIENQYPDYEVVAGRMDDFAEGLWEKRSELPVVTGEIGDSWIHGSASDSYKSAAIRTLIGCKNEWLADSSLLRGSDEYIGLCDKILCLCEHTCGMDVKRHFADYENYLKSDFQKARAADKVKLRHPFRDYPQNMLTIIERLKGEYNKGSYSAIEKSWAEQRLYIDKAVELLFDEHRVQAEKKISALRPKVIPELNGERLEAGKVYSFGNKSIRISINKNGGIGFLSFAGETVISENDKSLLTYHSYSGQDYSFWLDNYTRDIKKTESWAIGDFARPLIKYADGKYPVGAFAGQMTGGTVSGNKIKIDFAFPSQCSEKLGAPKKLSAVITMNDDKVEIELYWLEKDANRLTESISLNLMICTDKEHLKYLKIGSEINPYTTVKNGNRRLSAAESILFGNHILKSLHAPLVSLGETDILHFDNKQADVRTDGVSFVLYNNVWGTNFPLWYEDNAYFKFEII